MKKFTLITEQNIHLIAYRVLQFIKRHEKVETYTDFGWYRKALNRIFDKNKLRDELIITVERSQKGFILAKTMETRFRKSENTGYNWDKDQLLIYPCESMNVDCVTVGNRIRFSPNRIVVITQRDLQFNKEIYFQNLVKFIQPTAVPVEQIEAEHQFHNDYSDQYYNSLGFDEETEIDLEEEEFMRGFENSSQS